MLPKTICSFIIILLLGGVVTSTQAADYEKEPYILYRNTNTEMTVLWQADSTPASSYIEWGTDTGYGTSSGSLTESGSGVYEHQFEYTIASLTPGTQYFYRVYVDAAEREGSFTAAPAASAAKVIFYGFGDTRTNPNIMDTVTHAMLNDIAVDPASRHTISLHSADWNVDGSEADWAGDGNYFNRSYSNSMELLRSIAVNGCHGNHDNPVSVMRKYLSYNYADGSNTYYSFDYGPVHITVIDDQISFSLGSTQHTWISNDLAGTSKLWKVVVHHAPAWSAGGGHANSATAQSELCPLFEANDVALVLNGHNHYYSRCEVNGIQYVTIGGGGAPLHTPDMGSLNLVTAEATHHFARFAVNDTTMVGTAIRPNGSIVDAFQLNKGTDSTPPEIMAVTASGNPLQVLVSFSEKVEAGTGANGAENPANYSIPGLTITGASLDAFEMTVTLTLAADMANGQTYTLTAVTINDQAGSPNLMASDAMGYTFAAGPIIEAGDTWKYFKGTSFPGAAWNTVGFADSGWLEGASGFGYGDGDDATVLSDMQNSYASVYTRKTFNVTSAAAATDMSLEVDYDDGFVAFINGVEVARANVPASQTYTTLASAGHDAGIPQVFNLAAYLGDLNDGLNVLAIELHNVTLASSDASLIPELTITLDAGPAEGTLQFSTGAYSGTETSGTAVITVNRTGGSTGTVTVDYTVSNGTADATDFTPATDTLTFGDGVLSQTFSVAIADDTIPESGETVQLALTNPTGGAVLGPQNTAVLTIPANDSKTDSKEGGCSLALKGGMPGVFVLLGFLLAAAFIRQKRRAAC